jgi:hypothetical protein
VSHPSASESHISWLAGGRSILVMSTFSIANTSREIPEVKESERTVESYAPVYTFDGRGVET